MNIKKVSQLTGVSADTIRYYERIGLIPPIRRRQSGIRDFSQQDIDVLEFVRYFRGAGISVESLIEYIGLVELGGQTIEARLAILQVEKKPWKLVLKSLVRIWIDLIIKSITIRTRLFRVSINCLIKNKGVLYA